jgi:regulator of protease activity HflC (stomatin/prohibitin superfamily)
MVVLIDEEKVERMATDESFRTQYEGIISNASSGLSQLKTSIQNSGLSSSVKGYGMQVNDGGTASFFAVLKKSSADQKARIEKKREENKAEKKAEAKKEAKKKAAQKADEKADEKKAEESEKTDALYNDDTEDYDDDFIIISAGSIDELMQKLSDYEMAERSNNVQTESEKMLGQHIDFRM